MKIWTKIEWAILVAASTLLLLLLILFAYTHPHSDDYSYNSFLENKGFIEGSAYLFANNTGRFFSTAIIFLNPMKTHLIEPYRWITAILFSLFVLSLFLFFRILLHRFLSSRNVIILFALITLCFLAFVPNLHEFCYWFCAEATYLTAAILWLWAIILHALLAQKKYQHNLFLWLACAFNALAIAGCSESGIFLYGFILLISILYRRQHPELNNQKFSLVSFLFLGASAIAIVAPGNFNRHTHTAFSGNILFALSGGGYAAGFWLSKWAMIFMPIVCFYILLFGHRLVAWAAVVSCFWLFKARTIFILSLLFFLLCQILVVWMSGSMPEQRFENVLFLFLLISFLFAAQLMMYEQTEFFNMLKGNLHRGFKTLSFVYLLCVFIVVPNNFVHAFFDLVSGSAQQYDKENKLRYQFISKSKESIVQVPVITARPQLLYFSTLTCTNVPDTKDVPRIALAEYFGKKWIYEYPCNLVIPEYSVKEILKQKRAHFFSEKKQ